MTKRSLTILIVAIVLVGGATAVIASSLGGSDTPSASHVMPDGQTMNEGGMGTTQMHSMPDGQAMSGSHMDTGK